MKTEPVTAADAHGRQMLWYAAWNGFSDGPSDEARLRALLTAGLNVDVVDQEGRTPLWHAAGRGRTAVVRVLLEAGAADTRGGRYPPLHAAALFGHEEAVRALLENKDVDANQIDGMGRTPLYYARRQGHWEVVQALQAAGGAEAGVTRYDPRSIWEIDMGERTSIGYR